jgi:hypothetical protein
VVIRVLSSGLYPAAMTLMKPIDSRPTAKTLGRVTRRAKVDRIGRCECVVLYLYIC